MQIRIKKQLKKRASPFKAQHKLFSEKNDNFCFKDLNSYIIVKNIIIISTIIAF